MFTFYAISEAAGELELLEAVKTRNIAEVKSLLAKEVNVNQKEIYPQSNTLEKTPLIYACETMQLEAVQLLLKAGADPNLGDKNGNTPLYYAAKSNHMDIVNALLAYHANPNALQRNRNSLKQNKSPLSAAAKNGNLVMVKRLIKQGANPNGLIFENPSPLQNAIKKGRYEVTLFLLEQLLHLEGEDQPIDYGFLDLAAFYACEYGQLDILKYVLGRGVYPNERHPVMNIDLKAQARLLVGSAESQLQIVKLLMEYGAEPDATLHNGFDNLTKKSQWLMAYNAINRYIKDLKNTTRLFFDVYETWGRSQNVGPEAENLASIQLNLLFHLPFEILCEIISSSVMTENHFISHNHTRQLTGLFFARPSKINTPKILEAIVEIRHQSLKKIM